MRYAIQPSGDPPTGETSAETNVRAGQEASRIAGLGIAKEVIEGATELINFATNAVRTDYNYDRAEAIYNTQRMALQEQQGLASADAYARMTVNVARRLIQNGRTREEVAAGKRLLEEMERDTARRRQLAEAESEENVGKRGAILGYAIAGAAVLGLVITVVVLRKKPRANGSTRRRRAR